MEIAAYMLSCPERADVRARTLASWKASDWNRAARRHDLPHKQRTPYVVMDAASHGRRQERQERTARALLNRAVQDGAPCILFLEDDLEFNRHLRQNLEHWPPLAQVEAGGHFYASLYNPNVGALEHRPAENSFIAHPQSVYGSQAVLLARSTAAHILEHWDEVPGMQDIKMSRLAAQVCPLVFHSPSLVQHTGVNSVWGGVYHTARDYQAGWKAPSPAPQRKAVDWSSRGLDLPASILEAIPRAAILERVRPLEGWLSDAEADLLLRASAWAAQRLPAAVVEVGSYCGKGSLIIVLTLKALRSKQKLVAVDTFSGTVSAAGGGVMHTGPTLEKFKRNLKANGAMQRVKVIQGRSAEVEWDQPLALLLIDGLHDEPNLRCDFERFGRWLVPGGLVAFHDCAAGFPSVPAFVRELCNRGEFRLIEQAGSLAVLG